MTPGASWFVLDESAALLREIFPNYPDIRGKRKEPDDLQKWLDDYRAKKASE